MTAPARESTFTDDKLVISRSVPHAVVDPERVPVPRYYDDLFFQLERERLWTRTWQQVCRLEEIPEVGDFVEYRILGESVLVVRYSRDTVRAYFNACRHRGMPLATGRGRQPSGFVCPFHGWCWGTDGKNTFVRQPGIFSERALDSGDLALKECRAEVWGGTVFVNFDASARPLRESLEPFATLMDLYNVEQMTTLWWKATEVPANWKLCVEAFLECYHVPQTHPQMMGKARGKTGFAAQKGGGSSLVSATAPARTGAELGELTRDWLKAMGDDMDSWILPKDLAIMDDLGYDWLPADPVEAMKMYLPRVNDEIVARNRELGIPIGDLNAAGASGARPGVYFAFPNTFILPWFGNAVWYRFRPVTPESTIFEIRSTSFPARGETPEIPQGYTELACQDAGWPLVPRQDLANLTDHQRGLHTTGFEFMRLSKDIEGRISNFEQLIDGYLAGLPNERITPQLKHGNGPIDVPAKDVWAQEKES
jgi:glycine betaine catabolism A